MVSGRIERLPALDLLRGAAVAGMIVVTSPGDWATAYAPLRHADWNGWTATDMVFPAFLFSVGAALGLSFPRAFGKAGERAAYWRRVARRVAALIVLGLALEATYNLAIGMGAGFPGGPGLGHLRLPGILQRIALCYALAAFLLAGTAQRRADGLSHLRPRAIGLTIVLVLLGYAMLLAWVPVPGHGAGHLDPEGNLPAWIDRIVFTPPHLWPLGWATPGGPAVYDPEGLLSTLPAATDTLFGVLAAVLWRRHPGRAPLLLVVCGGALVAVGLLLDPVLVINKRIWTSSFALLSSGVATLALAAFAIAARSPVALRLLLPLRILGGNAVLAFVLSTLVGRLYGAPLIGPGAPTESPQHWLQARVMQVVPDPYLASLACALVVLTAITLTLWPLHHRAFHFRL